MALYRYRAATSAGELKRGVLDGLSREDAVQRLRRQGLKPIEAVEVAGGGRTPANAKPGARARAAMINAMGELGVLLEAGLTLERALSVCVDNIENPVVKAAFATLHARMREGAPLSKAVSENPALFPPMASAMCEAGEADGRLGPALSRLAESLDRAEALRQTVISSLAYPTLLIVVATGVILVILLVVVPQFEGLFSGGEAKLPFITRSVMAVSEGVRAWGWAVALAIVALVLVGRWRLRRPDARQAFDRAVLSWPLIGRLVREAQTAAFARTLGGLVDGGVALPQALAIAQRSVTNSWMAKAIAEVTAGLKRGGGLSGPLAAAGVFPPMATSFLRTGEETAELGKMLIRLADVLDRSVRSTIERLIAILTPAVTVFMGAVVATVIASLMSAILGFNDLALAP